MTDYRWDKTSKLTQLLGEVEVMHRIFSLLPRIPAQEERLLRHSLLKSAVYSAKIEGIPSTESAPRLEAQNLLGVYQQIFTKPTTEFTLELIKLFHRKALANLSPTAGQLRTEPWAVFNEAGIALHIAPPHYKLPELLTDYVAHINSLYDHPLEVAAAAQFIFEKIHPFADGNGRVGRLISAYLLHKGDYGFRGLLLLEEYIEKNRDLYYQSLNPSHNMTEFIDYFAQGVATQANLALEHLKHADAVANIPMLPRREEILALVTDHPRCTFDFIARRFMATNPKTLHFDIHWLLKKGLIKKLGVTRGVVYQAS